MNNCSWQLYFLLYFTFKLLHYRDKISLSPLVWEGIQTRVILEWHGIILQVGVQIEYLVWCGQQIWVSWSEADIKFLSSQVWNGYQTLNTLVWDGHQIWVPLSKVGIEFEYPGLRWVSNLSALLRWVSNLNTLVWFGHLMKNALPQQQKLIL